MVAAVYSSDLVDIYTDGTTTGWQAIGGGSSGLNQETDYFVQGSSCLSKSAFSNSTKGMIYNGGSVTVPSDGAIFSWVTHQTANSLDTIANGGLRVLTGTSTTAYKIHYIAGSDTVIYDDRWLCIPINYSIAADLTDGSPGATPSFFGVMAKMVGGPTKGAPLAIDAIRYGRGFSYTGGDLANGYANFEDASIYNDDITRRYGQIQKSGKAFKLQSLHQIGTSSTACDFRDSNRNIEILNTLKVTAAFNGFEINNLGSNVEWNNINISALGTVSRGTFTVNDDATVALNTCVFTDMSTFSLLGNTILTDCTLRRCDQIALNGATLDSCSIDSSTNSSAVLATTLANLTNTSFISDGTGHAVELTSIGAGSMDWSCTTTGYDAGVSGSPVTPTSTGNEDIYVSATTGTITINVVSGANTPSIRSAGAIVNVVAGLIPVSVVNIIAGSRVSIKNLTTDTVEYNDIALTDTVSVSVTYAASHVYEARVRSASSIPAYQPWKQSAPVAETGLQFIASQELD